MQSKAKQVIKVDKMWQLVLVSPVISSQHGSIKIHTLYKEVCSNMYYVDMSKEKYPSETQYQNHYSCRGR